MTLLLIDGTELLIRLHYNASLVMIGRDDVPIHGSMGFAETLLRLVKETEATHAAVLFEGENSDRYQKLCREHAARGSSARYLRKTDTPAIQREYLRKALDCLGICHREVLGSGVMETIAAITRAWQGHVVIASRESRYDQLLLGSVELVDCTELGSCYRDGLTFREESGLKPEQYPSLAALVGAQDYCIPGIRGITRKNACVLLRRFGDLEGILNNQDRIVNKRVRELLPGQEAQLRRNLQGIRFDPDQAPLLRPQEMLLPELPKNAREAFLEIGLL